MNFYYSSFPIAADVDDTRVDAHLFVIF